ncbi:MAG: YebC/PmpR family DNA-binding transcriptional regulator, partial [Bacteroidota bacterium]
GSLGTSGSVAFMFDRNCQFKIKNEEMDLEELELELIDFGAEEVFEDEDGIMIYGAFENFGSLQTSLEERSIEIISSGFERIPNVTKKLTPEQEADIEKLLEKIEDDDDVQNVYHTMA